MADALSHIDKDKWAKTLFDRGVSEDDLKQILQDLGLHDAKYKIKGKGKKARKVLVQDADEDFVKIVEQYKALEEAARQAGNAGNKAGKNIQNGVNQAGTSIGIIDKLKAAWHGLGAAMQANPMLAGIAGAAIAIPVIIGLIDLLTTSTEEHRAAMNKAREEYEASTKAIQEMEQELETYKARLLELRGLEAAGGLTDAQREELEHLEQVNKELLTRIELEKLLQADANAERGAEAYATLRGRAYAAPQASGNTIEIEGVAYAAGDNLTAEEAINQYTSSIAQLQAEQAAILAQSGGTEAQQQARIARLKELDELLQDQRAGLVGILHDVQALTSQMGNLSDAEADELAELESRYANDITSLSTEEYQRLMRLRELAEESGYKRTMVDIVNAALEVANAGSEAAAGVSELDGALGAVDAEGAISALKTEADGVQKLQDLLDQLDGEKKLPLDVLIQLMELFPDAAGSINSVAEAQEYLKTQIASTKREAANAYAQILINNQQWLQDTVDGNDTLRAALNAYLAGSVEGFSDAAKDKLKIETALMSQLSALWSQYSHLTTEQLRDTVALYEDLAIEQRVSQQELNDLRVMLQLREAIEAEWEKIRYPDAGEKEISKTKAAFQKVYNEWQHKLAMQEITVAEFYEWLNGDSGFRKYFSDQTKYLDEYTKYEKEVFDGRGETYSGFLSDIDHEIAGLERQEGTENAIIGKYREKQRLLLDITESLRSYLSSLGLTEDEIARNDLMQEYISQIHEAEDAINEVESNVHDTISGHVNNLIDLTEELIRQECEDMIDALEEQKEAYQDIIDRRKEMLQLAKREQDYQDSIAEQTKEISKVQARIDALALDDSREAALERAKLQEELAQMNKELQNEQAEHQLNATEDALDKELEDFHEYQDQRIEAIEEFLDNNERVNKAAMDRLDGMSKSLFDQLLEYAKHYTDTTQEELTEMWNAASAAAKKYNSIANAAQVYSDSDVNTKAQDILQQMRNNGNNYASTSDPVKRKQYADSSLKLGAQLQELLGVSVRRDGNGAWWIGDQPLFEVFKYHSGGEVGNNLTVRPKLNEQLALLEHGEIVVPPKASGVLSNLLELITKPISSLAGLKDATMGALQKVSPAIHLDASVHIDGALPDQVVLDVLKKHPYTVADVVARQLR